MQKLSHNQQIEVNYLASASHTTDAIRILNVDDEPCLLEVSKEILMAQGNFEVDNASCVEEALKKLETQSYDLIISDYEMPQKNGLQFLKKLREQNNEIPFILFTGRGREDVAIEALNLGADGYVNKQGNPETVYGELTHEIVQLSNQSRLKKELARSEEQFRQFFSSIPSAVAIYQAVDDGEDFIFKHFNNAAEKIEKINKAAVLGKRVTEVFPGVKDFGIFEVFRRVWKTGKTEYFPMALYHDQHDSGSWRENWVMKLPNGNISAIYNDITERKKVEEGLRVSEQKYRELIDGMSESVWVVDFEGNFLDVNNSAVKTLGTQGKSCFLWGFRVSIAI